MDRRMFLGTVGAAFVAAFLVAQAQQVAKIYRIGFLSLRAGPAAADEAFVQGLRDLGYEIGHDIIIEYRWADNDSARLRPLAEDLVRRKVDVIVASATPAIRAAMGATTTIPIVMVSPDPIGTGVVANLSHPGGNVTGVSIQASDLASKRVQILRDIVPGLTRIAFLGQAFPHPAQSQTQGATHIVAAEARAAGRDMGIDVRAHIIVDADELPATFDTIKREGCQAVFVQVGPLTYEHRRTIVAMAAQKRLPDLYETRDYVDVGGLVSYGPDPQERYRRAASYVDKILRGANPANMPVEQPTKFELIVNLNTAKVLGLTIPQSLLVRADEVIQ